MAHKINEITLKLNQANAAEGEEASNKVNNVLDLTERVLTKTDTLLDHVDRSLGRVCNQLEVILIILKWLLILAVVMISGAVTGLAYLVAIRSPIVASLYPGGNSKMFGLNLWA